MNGQAFIDALRALEEGEDVTPLVRLYGREATIWSPQVDGTQLPNGPDGAERFWREYRAAFQNIHSEFLSVTDADGRSFLEWESTGAMRDGSPCSYRGVSAIEWDGDRIQRFATYFDPAALPAVHQRAEATEEPNGEQQTQGMDGASYTFPRRAA